MSVLFICKGAKTPCYINRLFLCGVCFAMMIASPAFARESSALSEAQKFAALSPAYGIEEPARIVSPEASRQRQAPEVISPAAALAFALGVRSAISAPYHYSPKNPSAPLRRALSRSPNDPSSPDGCGRSILPKDRPPRLNAQK